MRIQSVVSVLIAAVTFAARGEINVSGDTTGATDTAAIQSALDAEKTGGGTVTLGSGTFYINTQLTVDGAVTLQGQGWDKTIVKQVAASAGEETRVATVKGNSTVKRLTLTGGRVKSTGSYKYGGGVLLTGGTISWCCITNNAVDCKSYGIGGGVGIPQSKGTIDHCIIADNEVKSASGNKGHGGGIGVYLPGGQITVDSCLVRGNRALITSDGSGYGGGMAIDWSGFSNPVTIRNTTFVGNSVGVAGGTGPTWGAGVYSDDDKAKKLTMLNCIFAGNSAANSSVVGDINDSSNTAYSYTVYMNNYCVGTVDYCCFDKATDVIGEHSVSGSAIFTNASAGDYTLSSTSPAKTSGTTYTGIGTDLAGNSFAAVPSMGCYEFGSSPTIIPGGEGEEEGEGEGDPDPSESLLPSGGNDSAAIQALIDAVASTHGTVTLGSGTFCLDAQLMVTNGVTLVGQGWEKTIIKPASGQKIRCAMVEGGAKIEGVTLTGGNVAKDAGAGAWVKDGTISWCCVSNNTASGSGSSGAGISFTGGHGTVDHCIVANNKISNASRCAAIGGNTPNGAVTVDTCLVYGNDCSGGTAGGIGAQAPSSATVLTIRNCTIADNTASYNAGGVYFNDGNGNGKIILVNNIIAGNKFGSTENNVLVDKACFDTANSSCCLIGSQTSYNGAYIKDKEVVASVSTFVCGSAPFVGSGDYRLSAAKELGYTDNTGSCVDLDQKARSGALDVGCYEFGGATPPEPQHTHVWGTPSYVWTAVTGGYTCKASAVCTGDGSHTTNLTVTASYKVTKEPTTEATGTGTYTATFAAPFATQTKDVTLDKLPKEDPPHVDPSDAAQPSGDATGAKDTKTIQDLIDAAAPSHGSVVLGSGVFYLNAQLMITNGVTLVGQGWAQTILKAASGKNIRLATIDGNAKLEKVTLTGGNFNYGAGAHVVDGTISWCCVSNNVQTGGNQYGGGVSFYQGRGQIDHSIVARNRQTAVGFGAGIGMKAQTGSVTIDTCLVYGNECTSGSGGGVMAESIGNGKAVMVLNCTITGNSTFYNGGGVHVKNGDNGTCVLINSIVSGNTSAKNSTNLDLTVENASVAGSAYNLFGTQAEAVGSGYAVGAAPFVGNGDYHLSEAMELDYETDDATSVDLDNLARSGRVDVGCYEFGGTPYVERPGLTIYVD